MAPLPGVVVAGVVVAGLLVVVKDEPLYRVAAVAAVQVSTVVRVERVCQRLGLLELSLRVGREALAVLVLVVLVAGKVRRVLLEHLGHLVRVELVGALGIILSVIRLLHTLLQGPV
jgi:hypothetical protein